MHGVLADYNPSSVEIGARGQKVWVILAYDRFRVGLHYMRPCLRVEVSVRQDSVRRLSI